LHFGKPKIRLKTKKAVSGWHTQAFRILYNKRGNGARLFWPVLTKSAILLKKQKKMKLDIDYFS